MTKKDSTVRAYRVSLWDQAVVVFACTAKDASWAVARAASEAGYRMFDARRDARVKRAPDLDSRRDPATHRYLTAYAEADL